MSDKPELIVNPLRSPHRHGTTGIYVRAKTVDNKWGSHDIAELGEMSLLAWLRSERGLAENVVRLLLGHEPVHEPAPPDALVEAAKNLMWYIEATGLDMSGDSEVAMKYINAVREAVKP